MLFLIFGGLIAFKSVFTKSRLTGRPTGSPLFDQNSDPRAGHRCSASTPLQAVAGQDVSAIESPTPRPRKRLELSTNSSTENSQLPSNLSQHSVHLPDFWPMNVIGYFKTIELLFNDNGVTSEHSKYAFLVTALSKNKNALSKVTDILQRLDDQVPYSQLKTALLDRYLSEQSESPHSLLYQCERGKDTVVEFLLRLKTRLGRHYDADSCLINDLIRHRLLESVDPQIRLGLYHYESGSVDDLARHANRLLDRCRRDRSEPHFRTNIADNQRQNNDQRLINEMLETQLDSLRRDVSNLVSNSPNTPHQPTGRQGEGFALHNRFMFDNRAPGENPTRPQAPVCHYHARFGNRAHNCTGPPCPFSATSRNLMPSRPHNSQLNNMSQFSFDDPLFFKVDKISGVTLVTTRCDLDNATYARRNLQPYPLSVFTVTTMPCNQRLSTLQTDISLSHCLQRS